MKKAYYKQKGEKSQDDSRSKQELKFTVISTKQADLIKKATALLAGKWQVQPLEPHVGAHLQS